MAMAKDEKDEDEGVTQTEFDIILRKLRETEDKLLKTKGADYTAGSTNRLVNFYDAARILRKDVREIWAVLFYKHVSAVLAWAATGTTESESLMSRMADIRNYAALGLAIAHAERDDCYRQHPATEEAIATALAQPRPRVVALTD
jgi:hypothetical protein